MVSGLLQVDPAIGEAGDIDTSVAMLTFENGVVATVDNSRKATYGYDQRVEVFGSKVRVSRARVSETASSALPGGEMKKDLSLSWRGNESFNIFLAAWMCVGVRACGACVRACVCLVCLVFAHEHGAGWQARQPYKE